MNVSTVTLHSILTPGYRYRIPLYQRQYSWKVDNWEQLWDDIQAQSISNQANDLHFMGTLVFVSEPPAPSVPPAFKVIDGQQRLITLSLLLCALRDVANQHELLDLGEEVTNQYLVHPYQKGELRFRISPKQLDREHYFAAVQSKSIPAGSIHSALEFFTKSIIAYVREKTVASTVDVALRGLLGLVGNHLQFVQIYLDGENPFRIFRSLNSTGTALTESDLIRNFVFMGVPDQNHVEFDEQLWKPLEKHFEVKESKTSSTLSDDATLKVDGAAFSKFLRDYLIQDGKYIGDSATLEEFESRYGSTMTPTNLVEELENNARLYDVIRGIRSHSSGFKKIDEALAQMRQLDNTTPFPLVLNLLNRVDKGTLNLLGSIPGGLPRYC